MKRPHRQPKAAPRLVDASHAALLDRFLKRFPNANTRRSYESACAAYLADYGAVGLEQLVEYRELLLVRQAAGDIAPATVAAKLNALRGFANYLRIQGAVEISRDQLDVDLEIPTVSRQSTYAVLTKEEIGELLAGVQPGPFLYRDRLIIGLGCATGLRVSELASVRLGHIADGWLHVHLGKGAKNRRVPLGTATQARINDYVALSGRDWQRRSDRESILFQGLQGGITAGRMWQIVKAAARAAKLTKPISPHVFRHTATVMWLRGGIPIHLVRLLLGHSSIATTQIYADHEVEAQELRRHFP